MSKVFCTRLTSESGLSVKEVELLVEGLQEKGKQKGYNECLGGLVEGVDKRDSVRKTWDLYNTPIDNLLDFANTILEKVFQVEVTLAC